MSLSQITGNWDIPKTIVHGALVAGFFFLGYKTGTGQWNIFHKKVKVAKSYMAGGDPVKSYCLEHSSPLNKVQEKLMNDTLKHPRFRMLGAPEVICLNGAIIKALKAKKVIDVGVFTGASTLAAAVALPPDGKVVACDISEEYTRQAETYWKEAGVDDKVDLRIAPAGETLKSLIDDGQAETFDFAFIDADKTGYDSYYELCLQLLKSGGVIAFDNTLWSEKVLKPPEECDVDTLALKRLNDKLAKDHGRAYVVQLNVGDGYTIAVKL